MTLRGVAGAAVTSAGLVRPLLQLGGHVAPVRQNFHGSPVSLAAGPAVCIAASAGAFVGRRNATLGRAGLLTGLACGGLGALDDIIGARPDAVHAKGIGGHLGALRRGRVSTGLVKLVGIAATGLLATRPLMRSPLDTVVAGAVVAGTANLVNLLDLRPGRAGKATLLIAGPLLAGRGAPLAASVAAATVIALPGDLAERTMLGDCGANALGGLLGLAAVDSLPGPGRVALLLTLITLTLLSERRSFSEIIAATPVLRELDALGRRDAGPASAAAR